jgi:hypothetical protein
MTAAPTPADQRSATRIVFPEPRRVELKVMAVRAITGPRRRARVPHLAAGSQSSGECTAGVSRAAS